MSAIALSNISISEISLVKAGANGLEFIAKSGVPVRLVTISKTDKVKKVVYGVVYEPDVLDSQGEKATAAEIEKACWSAMKNNAVVKTDHTDPAKAYLCESFIAKAGDPDGFKLGAWVAGVKIEDDALWADVEKGIYKAFSMGGEAEKTPVEKSAAQKAIEAALPITTVEKFEAVQKAITGDSLVYASDLASALKLLQAISPLVDGVSKTMGELQKQLALTHALAKQAVENTAKLGEIHATAEKIAKTVTDGHISSSTPGNPAPGVDPKKY